MRYSTYILIIFLSILSCSSPNPEIMHLTGAVKGLEKGTLLLQKFEDTVLVTVDSMDINGNSQFSFSEKVESPEIYYLYVRLKDGTLKDDRIQFFGENGNVNIETNLEKFGSAAKVSGSKNDSLLRDYYLLKQRYITKNLDFIEVRINARTKNTDSLVKEIDRKQQSLQASQNFATINFAIKNSDYEVAPFLMLSEAYNSQIKYLDTVYNTLSPKIKDSKYGKELESFIKTSKEADTLL
ncbi:DUF4369 domain-containing protein [Aequorivita sp. H23M31]|uniref:DUF4369 domain-containing protein n=1 Tax=Aequorivita ciconiae TaxID=2494375 RepID=A0A410G1R8_9FLAO|nr:DUF4369 domain-containing protein [Aequorivita sp. H23M31]QAA81185.1 DUF4369 domain-containing protein [Aequorivita sp. H23M31]